MSRENEPLLDPTMLDDRPGPARPLSDAESAALARRAFDRSGYRWSGLRRLFAVAAAFLVLAGAAGAWAYLRKSRAVSPVPPPPPVAPAQSANVETARPNPPVVLEASPLPAPHHPAPPSRHVAAAPVETDLLRQANQLRAERKWRDAERIYAGIVRSAPQSEDVAVASVAAASLRLEHLGDPKGALALYQKAVRGAEKGPLAEEASYGVAQSYRALRDRTEERRALESFIRLHPTSVLIPEAKDRLSALGQ